MAGLTMPKPFVARPSAVRMGCLIAVSLPLIAIGLLILFGNAPAPGPLIGIIILLFFGVVAGFAISRLRDPKPVIRLDERGIYWRLWSDDVIAWEDIEMIETATAHAWGKCFCIHLRDLEKYPPSGFLGRIAGGHKRPAVGDIALTPLGTNRSWNELFDAFAQYLPRLD
jgi:hypothetical protein